MAGYDDAGCGKKNHVSSLPDVWTTQFFLMSSVYSTLASQSVVLSTRLPRTASGEAANRVTATRIASPARLIFKASARRGEVDS